MKDKAIFNCNLKNILIDICIICLFLSLSYFFISSRYNFMIGDDGTYAFKTKLLYEQHKIDLKAQSALSFGQLIFGYVFCIIFGFSLRTLNISAYFAAFFCMLSFYLILLQLNIDRYLALIGSLCLYINPIALQFIDWYMTESYFLFYFLIAMNFYVAGFKYNKVKYFYLGALFSTIAVFTRQFALSLSVALIVLLLIRRKELKTNFIHIFLSAIIPVLSLIIFYKTYVSLGDTLQLYTPRMMYFKKMLNPLFLIFVLLKDAFYTFHYSAIYALPLVLLLFIAAFFKRKYFKELFLGKKIIFLISFIFMSFGTLISYVRYKKLMPYLPSIFSIGRITSFFGVKIIENHTASLLLTIFTMLGGMVIFYKMLEHMDWKKVKNVLIGKEKSGGEALAYYLIFFTCFFYYLTNSASFLIYERYIFPFTIFIIFFLVLKCNWIQNFKKTSFIIFFIIYSLFIFNVKKSRIQHESIWDAANFLMEKGVKPIEINAGCGFGYYYNFYPIFNLYKNTKINRPFNWHKFHPLANYFILSSAKKGRHPGLEQIGVIENESRFDIFKKKAYIFRRKANFKDPIWV